MLRLAKNEEGFVVTTGDGRIESHNVVVAMGTHQILTSSSTSPPGRAESLVRPSSSRSTQ